MERLYGILPVKKSEIVTGRYLFILALGALALVVFLITQPIVLWAMGEKVELFDIISTAIGVLFLFALYTVFQIPQMPADHPILATIASSPVLLVALAIVLVVVMYAVSIWFYIRIMENKEM